MDIQKIELSPEESQMFGSAMGLETEVAKTEEASVDETSQEVINTEETSTEQEVIEVEQEVVNEETTTNEVIEEEPQLIIQDEEPIVEEKKIEEAPTKVKAKIYKDSFQAALNKYYNSTENPDVEAFARAYNSNYDNLSPIEIIRQEIASDPLNKGLKPHLIERLLNDRLSKFEYDSDDEDEKEYKDHLLRREAETVKSRMIQSGKEFVAQFQSDDLEIELDAPLAQKEAEPTEEELKAQRDALVAQYSPEVSKFVRNGVIQIKDKDGVINIPAVSNEDYVEAFINPVGFLQSIALNPDGTPNMGRWIQFVTAAKNLTTYNSTMIKHGIALGQDKMASKIKNEAPLVQARPTDADVEFKTIQEDPLGFANAMANIKPWQNK